jgi:hypothetical protein
MRLVDWYEQRSVPITERTGGLCLSSKSIICQFWPTVQHRLAGLEDSLS